MGSPGVDEPSPAEPPHELVERTELLTGWSRTAPTAATVLEVRDADDVDTGLARAGRRGLIARGLGRS